MQKKRERMQRLNKQKKRGGEDKKEELKQTKKEGVLKGRMIKFFLSWQKLKTLFVMYK